MEAIQTRKYTVEEFEALPEDERYELIEGELYAMASSERIHQELVTNLLGDILAHIRSEKGDCRVYPAPFGVRLSAEEDTVVEPDITVVCDKNKLTKKGCTGAPDWIIEIVSPGNPAHDYIEKLRLYFKAGVREYWIVNPDSRNVTVYDVTRDYVPAAYTLEDTVKVGIYDDLEIDFKEIMERVGE